MLPSRRKVFKGRLAVVDQRYDDLPVAGRVDLEVSGDSMVEEGILDGDFALIRKVDTARDGEIVVALIDDSEATLKTFRREGSMIRLDPANRHYEPQRYRPEQVAIQGRLAGLIRRY